MIKLNNDQLKQLADFVSNLGLVFAASIITPLFSKNVDKIDLLSVVLGLLSSLTSLFLSLTILSLSKREKGKL